MTETFAPRNLDVRVFNSFGAPHILKYRMVDKTGNQSKDFFSMMGYRRQTIKDKHMSFEEPMLTFPVEKWQDVCGKFKENNAVYNVLLNKKNHTIENLLEYVVFGKVKLITSQKPTLETKQLYAQNPLCIEDLFVCLENRMLGIGESILRYIENQAFKKNHDMVYGHIPENATFVPEKLFGNPSYDVREVKEWLSRRGYTTSSTNNFYYKKILTNP
jgi:hypothetical protein